MKRFSLLLLVAACLALAGCAGGSASLAKQESPFKVDAAYVAKVESLARTRGVEVKWVNPPREADRQIARR